MEKRFSAESAFFTGKKRLPGNEQSQQVVESKLFPIFATG